MTIDVYSKFDAEMSSLASDSEEHNNIPKYSEIFNAVKNGSQDESFALLYRCTCTRYDSKKKS